MGDSDKFEVTLDVSEYSPEELKVTTMGNTVSVEGKRQTGNKNVDGSQEASSSKSFSRKWTLPPECKAESVVSNLSSDGVLMITAPRRDAIGHADPLKVIK